MINFSQLFVTALSVCVLAICLVYPDEGAVEDENVAESEGVERKRTWQELE